MCTFVDLVNVAVVDAVDVGGGRGGGGDGANVMLFHSSKYRPIRASHFSFTNSSLRFSN